MCCVCEFLGRFGFGSGRGGKYNTEEACEACGTKIGNQILATTSFGGSRFSIL